MRPIDADALLTVPNVNKVTEYDETGCGISYNAVSVENIEKAPTLDYAPVRCGEWELKAEAFYADNLFEEIDLRIYIVAKCSKCGHKHPDVYQVYSKDVCAEDCNALFDVEREKQLALEEFRKISYTFANFCPNCGAKMDGGKVDG